MLRLLVPGFTIALVSNFHRQPKQTKNARAVTTTATWALVLPDAPPLLLITISYCNIYIALS